MIELVLTYCLLANVSSCVERRPVLEEAFTPITCMMAAQYLGASHTIEHPDYRLVSWRCEIARPRERHI